MTPTDLERVGAALYGPSWRSALATALGVTDRTLRRWIDGTRAMPAGLRADLAALTRERRAALGEVLAELR